MGQKTYMSISEFARITGIKAANLRFYDKIGLLSPECRQENDYRQYSKQQLSTAYLIIELREIGIGIPEIQQYVEKRTPQQMFHLFEIQKKKIRDEVKKLRTLGNIMDIYEEMARDALEQEEHGVVIERRKKEPIFIGMDLPREMKEEDGTISFYQYAREKGLELGYPLGVVIARDDFEAEDPSHVLKYYFKVKNKGNCYKPEGLYVSAYGRCRIGQSEAVYGKLLRYIENNKLRMIGNAYEEYPLNEISVKNEEEYCVKVEIMVERFDT